MESKPKPLESWTVLTFRRLRSQGWTVRASWEYIREFRPIPGIRRSWAPGRAYYVDSWGYCW